MAIGQGLQCGSPNELIKKMFTNLMGVKIEKEP